MLCPRCQRPLADDSEGPYICCAGAPMQWRCDGCGKLSEGFALPYGRCPQCGGALQLCEGERATPGGAALHAVRMAFEIELGGRAFYQRAAADSGAAQDIIPIEVESAEGRKSSDDFGCVGLVRSNEDVEVARCSGNAVRREGMGTYDDELDAVASKLEQQIEEIGIEPLFDRHLPALRTIWPGASRRS